MSAVPISERTKKFQNKTESKQTAKQLSCNNTEIWRKSVVRQPQLPWHLDILRTCMRNTDLMWVFVLPEMGAEKPHVTSLFIFLWIFWGTFRITLGLAPQTSLDLKGLCTELCEAVFSHLWTSAPHVCNGGSYIAVPYRHVMSLSILKYILEVRLET